jgi:hypothetical protein
MRKRKIAIKDQVIAALKKRFTTVPELVKECGISKVHARSIIYGLGRKVRRQPIEDAAFTAYRFKK